MYFVFSKMKFAAILLKSIVLHENSSPRDLYTTTLITSVRSQPQRSAPSIQNHSRLVNLYHRHFASVHLNSYNELNKITQGMSCEGVCAHAQVRCAVARVRVRAKSILKSVRDVRACGSFLSVRSAITLLHTFWNKTDKKWHFSVLKTVLEHSFLFQNILFSFRTSFPAFKHSFLL